METRSNHVLVGAVVLILLVMLALFTVWIAWKQRGGYPLAKIFHFEGNRDAVRRQAVHAALRGLPNSLA